MKKMHIKAEDTVVVLSGNNKGDKAKVIATSPDEGKVIVKGVRIAHKHVKPRKQGESGGIIETEGAIYASKVALYCPNCDKGVRAKTKIETKEVDGKTKKIKTRICAKCGKEI